MARNYQKEYRNYDSKPKRVKARVARNKARRIMKRAGLAKVGDNKDVHHIDDNTRNNSRSNIRMRAQSSNRSYPRTRTARKK